VPRPVVWLGIALIAGAGLYVFARESSRASGRRTVRWLRPVRSGADERGHKIARR